MGRRFILMVLLGVVGCSDIVSVATDAAIPNDLGGDGIVVDALRLEGPVRDGIGRDLPMPPDFVLPQDLPGQNDLPLLPDLTPDDGAGPEQGSGLCPASEPVAFSGCSQNGTHCAYGDKVECGNVWECFENNWQLAYGGPDCATTTAGLCPAQQPKGFCDATVFNCRYDTIQCTCRSVCSGPQPLPGQENEWACGLPQTVACPPKAPKLGDPCSFAALECIYGHCGPTIATCFGGVWDVVNIPPPP
jgi:hypothetical protein